ncbi:hypothetical protein KSP40_PGU011958 [Platanthera guangdongensis]|uniref:DUF599 domain-containing protein n=1 Tax=Platanthera guangdongensis TaxID=2320717 RepID=A0ABR2MXI0_9ASPA
MAWKEGYLDLVLVPLSLLMSIVYHGWLRHRTRTQPRSTVVGMSFAAGRLWVDWMMKENDRRSVLAVQTLRNGIMGSTLMATTTILLCSGLAAIISSTYSVKKPIFDSIYGDHGELVVVVKYISLLLFFLFSFICYSLSICFHSQVSFLVNTPPCDAFDCRISPEYVSDMLDRGFLLNMLGNRLFFAALPLLFWVFGAVMVFICSAIMIPVLYIQDVAWERKGSKVGDGGRCGGGGDDDNGGEKSIACMIV